MNLFRICAIGSEDDVLSKISYLELWGSPVQWSGTIYAIRKRGSWGLFM